MVLDKIFFLIQQPMIKADKVIRKAHLEATSKPIFTDKQIKFSSRKLKGKTNISLHVYLHIKV